ncbi:hypothetical protein [Hymenobacter sp. BRD67]|uniref:hypothetical protein n=1 Tax=Hymenobacter sp. BRD67 TaxID=2675877 RepID=UPI001566ED0B|nr:hypothetical protein [Hymenobacter sp. BRD67]QKG51243.1 hypothetical protein GKZ67_09235 [Hymenobacter sp. BRD67]
MSSSTNAPIDCWWSPGTGSTSRRCRRLAACATVMVSARVVALSSVPVMNSQGHFTLDATRL